VSPASAFIAPVPVQHASFQQAWLTVARVLLARRDALRNVLVQVTDPLAIDDAFHDTFEAAVRSEGLLGAKHVAYTVFPHRLYEHVGSGTALYEAYNRPQGMYDRVKTSWGTYFRRMTAYQPPGSTKPPVNQLKNIITKINGRKAVFTAAHTIVIPYTGTETARERGAPCLNYVSVQLQREPRRLGLLAVYRNHDFLHKAYGNYWSLTNLIRFLCDETGFTPGVLTCVSSHAYTDKPAILKRVVRPFDGISPATISAS